MTAGRDDRRMIPMRSAVAGEGKHKRSTFARRHRRPAVRDGRQPLLIVPSLFAILRKGKTEKPHHCVFE